MKTLLYTLVAVLGVHTAAHSEPAPPHDYRQDAVWLAIDQVEDQAKPGTYVTCVTCSVRGARDEEKMEATGRAWIELITLPLPGVTPTVFARREAILKADAETGRTNFFGFFPGAHGTYSGHWPNLIIEVRPKDATDDTQNVRLSLFRLLSEREAKNTEVLENIDVPKEYRTRTPPPRVHERERERNEPRKRSMRPIPLPSQPEHPVPPKTNPEPAPAKPAVPKEEQKPRRSTPPQPLRFATDTIA